MRQISLELCTLTQRLSISSGSSPLRFEAFVRRSHTYIQELLLDSSTSAAKVRKRLQALKLPRYLGVVRLFKAGREPIDVLIDTTSTPRNLHYVDVIALGIASEETQELATDILAEFRRHNLVGVH